MLGDLGAGRYGLRFEHPGVFTDMLEEIGAPPLPHYIERLRRVEEKRPGELPDGLCRRAGLGGGAHRGTALYA